jgi:hypothetical protein
MKQRQPKVVPDAARPAMWRVRWSDGRVSDMTNLTRAKDAVVCFIETEGRRQRGRHSPSGGRLSVKTDSWGGSGMSAMPLWQTHCTHAARETVARRGSMAGKRSGSKRRGEPFVVSLLF